MFWRALAGLPCCCWLRRSQLEQASISLYPVRIPGGSTFMEWKMELLTEQSAVQTMHDSMRGIMELGFASEPACCTACSLHILLLMLCLYPTL